MPRPERALFGGLALFAVLITTLAVTAYARTAPDVVAEPADEASAWAIAALEAFRRSEPLPEPPASARAYRAAAPIVVLAFEQGRIVARAEAERGLVEAVRHAIGSFGAVPELSAGTAFRDARDDHARFSLTIPLGDGHAPVGVPWLESFAYVPLRDALVVTLGSRSVTLVPDEMVLAGLVRGHLPTGLTELDVGVPIDEAIAALAERIGSTSSELRRSGRFMHRRVALVSSDAYPRFVEPSPEAVREGVLEAASFLLRVLTPAGTFVYEVDSRTGVDTGATDYSLPRHAGAASFLAHAGRVLDVRRFRVGAARSMDWMIRTHLRSCGAAERLCFGHGELVDAGNAALAILALSELERFEREDERRRIVGGLAEYLLAQQRPDGEIRHFTDGETGRPIDRQLPYYTGSMSLALLRAHEVTGDARFLRAAERALRYLATRSWSFPASRYVHAEEHWTCIAAGESRGRFDLPELRDFCRSVFAWNEWAAQGPGDTPWPVEGNYGFGPLFAPRHAALGTRIESFVELERLLAHHGEVPETLGPHVRRGIRAILGLQLRPGPTRFMAYPELVRGGMAGSVTDPIIRIDHVQHAGSALVRYLELLDAERRGGRTAVGRAIAPLR